MTSTTHDAEAWPALTQALADLEAAACDAIVPGELRPWCEAILPRMEDVSKLWKRQARHERGTRAQIVADDPALTPRVEALAEDADALGRTLDELLSRTRSMRRRDVVEAAGSAEPTESLEQVRRDVLEWIVSLRAHHGEVGTWLREAANRDRGVRD